MRVNLREAARHVWIVDKMGHDFEWSYHWNFSENYRANKPGLWRMTIYPAWRRKSRVVQILMMSGIIKPEA
jgi:hypothetical protein